MNIGTVYCKYCSSPIQILLSPRMKEIVDKRGLVCNRDDCMERYEKEKQVQEVVRDTEYQIKRMLDTIDYAYTDCGLDCEGYRKLKLEFEECIKIMRSK